MTEAATDNWVWGFNFCKFVENILSPFWKAMDSTCNLREVRFTCHCVCAFRCDFRTYITFLKLIEKYSHYLFFYYFSVFYYILSILMLFYIQDCRCRSWDKKLSKWCDDIEPYQCCGYVWTFWVSINRHLPCVWCVNSSTTSSSFSVLRVLIIRLWHLLIDF